MLYDMYVLPIGVIIKNNNNATHPYFAVFFLYCVVNM